jgi:hypothetical protein
MLLRGRREVALQFYGRARERVNEEGGGMGEILARHSRACPQTSRSSGSRR